MGGKYCFTHSPEHKSQHKDAVRKGGSTLRVAKQSMILPDIPVREIGDLRILLEDTISRVRTEPMTHQKANCIGYLANICIKAFELTELSDRISIIEDQISSDGKSKN